MHKNDKKRLFWRAFTVMSVIFCSAIVVISCSAWPIRRTIEDAGRFFHTVSAETVAETPEWAISFAERVFEAWRDRKPMPQISVAHPDATLAEAYLVQRHFVGRMLETEAIGGYKAAGVASTAPEYPLIAVKPASGIRQGTDTIIIDLAQDPNRHVETEIGYVFGQAVTEPIDDLDALRAVVSAIVAIVEVPGNAVEEHSPATANDIVAWNINGKEMILGAEHKPDAINPDEVAITLTHNDTISNTARGDLAAGGQWPTLLRTVNHLLAQGYTLQPGHVITNGALGKILKAAPGRYRADFGPLGIIEFEVTQSSP